MIYLNGALIAPERACIDPRDRGFLLGDGLFETLRAEAGRVLFLEAHLARLRHGASVLGIPVPLDDDALADAIRRTLEANGLDRNAALRLTLTRGPGPRGLAPPIDPRPTLLITAVPIAGEPPPATAIVASPRRNEHSPLAAIKSLCYLDNVLAQAEALARGADEALLRNTAGYLCEAAAANLFLVIDGVVCTPALADGPLPGITRAVVLELARSSGLMLAERRLAVEELAAANEAFLTNSLIGIRPLRCFDGRPIGDQVPGPVTRRLAAAYSDLTRRQAAACTWSGSLMPRRWA